MMLENLASDLTPRGRGRKFWRSVVAEFDLRADELELLAEAARMMDLLDVLRERVEDDGPMVDTPQGMRMHPAVVESRQVRQELRRHLSQLRLPDVDDQAEDELTARRTRTRRGA